MPFFKSYRNFFYQGDLIYGYGTEQAHYKTLPNFCFTREWGSNIDNYMLDFEKAQYPFDIDPVLPCDHQYFVEYILQHQKYKEIILQDRSTYRSNYTTSMGRKCKAGLGWASKDCKHVHFILDSIDMTTVIDKIKWLQGYPKKQYCAFTHVELRWIYRNRFSLDVQKHIQFWNQDKPCPPPWTDEYSDYADIGYIPSELWSSYDNDVI